MISEPVEAVPRIVLAARLEVACSVERRGDDFASLWVAWPSCWTDSCRAFRGRLSRTAIAVAVRYPIRRDCSRRWVVRLRRSG